MDSIYEAVKNDRAKNSASDFSGIRPSILQAARASLAQKTEAIDEELGETQQLNVIESNNGGADLSAHNNDTQSATKVAPPNPNTKSVMFAHIQQQEQQEQNQQTQEQDKQQDEQLTLVRGLGHYQHGEKRERDISNEHRKMRENPDLLVIKNNGQYLLLTTRELFERNKDKSIEEQIEFAKNAVNYTQSVEAAKKQGKSEAAFMKELGLPFSIKNERLERLRKQYMENQTSLDYNQRNAHLKDRIYYNEIQEAFEGVGSSSIAAVPTRFVGNTLKGLFGFASEGSIPVTRDQSVDEQMLALEDIRNQQEFMRYIHTLKSGFKEESVLSNVYHSLRGNDDVLKENKNNGYKRILEALQQKMPSITKCGEMEDGSFFVDFPDNQRMFFKNDFLDYLDTTAKNNQMEIAAGIVAALIAAPVVAYAGAGAAGGFFLTTAAGAFGSGLGAFYDFQRIAANNPAGTYTSADRNAKILDAAALSIVGDLAIGGAIWSAKAAWRAIPTAEGKAVK
ncbi:MAG: hypothetical protein K2N12_07085, partial [Helicobacter sp.]|nr:hypothetical protein [Helicobacter sp.]